MPVKTRVRLQEIREGFWPGAEDRHKMVRVGTLCPRLHSQDQQTLPMQNRAMREYTARRGWTIAMQVKEVGSRSSTTATPG